MPIKQQYDVAIIGGGLAGLACAIQLSKDGHSVVLFEKEKYPFHKVCGEYVSLESQDFLQQLGLPLSEMQLPMIDTLFLSAPNGKSITTRLPLGGFGISRYLLDSQLATIARQNGVVVLEETKVDEVKFDGVFQIHTRSPLTGQKILEARLCCAAYGKRSNLDVKWKREFLNGLDKGAHNYVGVKYHVKSNWKTNVIGLHNFEGGYCGISKIEEDRYCLCYMTKSEKLNRCHNSIELLQTTVLQQNPHLKKIWMESERIQHFPITISQINFQSKSRVEGHVLMLGDAAGMIAPLCGNGMSIALHTGKLSAGLIHQYLKGAISGAQLEKQYEQQWRHYFVWRLRAGRVLQTYFGRTRLSNTFVGLFKTFPLLAGPLIRLTHGRPF